jgi:hypothetical protein
VTEEIVKIELGERTITAIRKFLWNYEYDEDEARKILVLNEQELLDYFIDRNISYPVITDDYFNVQIEEAHQYYTNGEDVE